MKRIGKKLLNILNKSILLILLFFFIISINNYIKKSDYYNIKKIIISGNQYLEQENIKKIIANDISMKNIFNINFNKIQSKLHDDSFIYSSQVYTLFPSSLYITINEIKPIGLWQIGSKTYFINYFSDKIEVDLKKDYKSLNHYNIPTIMINSGNYSHNDELRIKNILKNILKKSSLFFKNINEVYINEANIKISLDKKTTLKLNNNDNLFNELELMIQFYNHMKGEIYMYEYIDFSTNNQIIVKEKNIKI